MKKPAKRARRLEPSTVIHTDCRHYVGHIPCKPHKLHGVHCDGCSFYEPQTQHILIIKLGAIGDVIRTTPLLDPLRRQYPKARIYWITYYPQMVPSVVDVVLDFSLQNLTYLRAIRFDLILNLDKDREACALSSSLTAKKRKGFSLHEGKPVASNPESRKKLARGLFDDMSKKNRQSYLEETFEMCGYDFKGEEYVLDTDGDSKQWDVDQKKIVVGLNTGCGSRWPSRLWSVDRWAELARKLAESGYEVVLLGGEQEDKANKAIQSQSPSKYLGYFGFKEFISLVNACDVLVTQVTMALHIGIGLRKRVVLLNNIFNKHEFELYGRGVIIEPAKSCQCYFSPRCTNPDYFCMEHLSVEAVFKGIRETAAGVEKKKTLTGRS